MWGKRNIVWTKPNEQPNQKEIFEENLVIFKAQELALWYDRDKRDSDWNTYQKPFSH